MTTHIEAPSPSKKVIVDVEGSLNIRDKTAVARLATIRRYRDFVDRAGMAIWMP